MPVPSSLAGLSAPVLDIKAAPVFDIVLAVSSIDGTETTVDEGTHRRIVLASSVLFAESKAKLTAAARKTLATTAQQIIASKASGLVQINGYTDNQGSAATVSYSRAVERKRFAPLSHRHWPVRGYGLRPRATGRHTRSQPTPPSVGKPRTVEWRSGSRPPPAEAVWRTRHDARWVTTCVRSRCSISADLAARLREHIKQYGLGPDDRFAAGHRTNHVAIDWAREAETGWVNQVCANQMLHSQTSTRDAG